MPSRHRPGWSLILPRWRVIEKCGFQWIGAGLTRSRLLASSVPVDKFRLDRTLWASLKAWRDPILRRSAPKVVIGSLA